MRIHSNNLLVLTTTFLLFLIPQRARSWGTSHGTCTYSSRVPSSSFSSSSSSSSSYSSFKRTHFDTARPTRGHHERFVMPKRKDILLRMRSSTSTNSPPSPVPTADVKEQVAQTKGSLHKILERQKRELLETERLLEQVSTLEPLTNDTATYSSLLQRTDGGIMIPIIARSMMAGVDYGFVSRSEGCLFEDYSPKNPNSDLLDNRNYYGPPANVVTLGSQQFMRNLNAILGEYSRHESSDSLTPYQQTLQLQLKKLTLNSTAIWERERARGPIVAPLIIKGPYYILCLLLDFVFENAFVPSRFFLLETVARMPYFSYISMLQLYETLGFWRRSADVKRIHFAEEWNEYHHLLIMESLGGDQAWWVRFFAQHAAVLYFITLSILWMASPSLSYKFSELLETHAVDTYGTFIDENEEVLKRLPPPLAATDYYTIGVVDPMFGEYQTTARENIRKPGVNMTSLYDVFVAIRSDEGDHVGTMKSCLDPTVAVLSPSLESRTLTGVVLATIAASFLSGGDFISDTAAYLEGFDDTFAADTLIGGVVTGAANIIQNLASSIEEGEVIGTEIDVELESIGIFPALIKLLKSIRFL